MRTTLHLILALVAGLAACQREPDDPPAPIPVPRAETGCTSCHDQAHDDPGDVHSADRVACNLCHGGDPRATHELAAHRGLEREPGALDTVDSTCGQCHQREVDRVRTSPMAEGRGLIAVDRWAFGELEVPNGEQTFHDLLAVSDPSPAEDHLQRLCAGCHLETRRDNRDDAIHGIGSGCSSCHVGTDAGSSSHPTIDAFVPDERCLGCHSRSARISLSYQGLAEVSGPHADQCARPVELHDGRTGCAADDDVHHAAGMSCTDCHVHTELMGDGTSYAHEQDALEVRCESCHGPAGARETTWSEIEDPITETILRRRGQTRDPAERVRTGDRGTPLWNVRPGEGLTWLLERKADGEVLAIPQTPEDPHHQQVGHERLSCASCHAGWAPTCTSCHTSHDAGGEQWSFAVGAVAPGRWVETNEGMGIAPPVLGVDPHDRIQPAIPGMIATLELAAAGGADQSLRLYSLLDPHTTQAQGRTCASCHRSSWTLGLPEGALGEIEESTHLHLWGADREAFWTTLDAETPGASTRVGARSLDHDELQRVTEVGACLVCHDVADTLWSRWNIAFPQWHQGSTTCPHRPD